MNNDQKKKFILGRNLLTLILVFVTLLLISFVVFAADRVKARNKLLENVKLYSDKSECEAVTDYIDTSNIKRVKASKFDYLNITFYCSIYEDNYEGYYVKKKNKTNTDNHDELTFKLRLKKNDNTGKTRLDDNSYIAYVNVAIGANKIGDTGYSTTVKRCTDSNIFSTSYTTFKVDSTVSYPCKIKSWPFTNNVSSPDAYVYLRYNTYDEVGNAIVKEFVIKYTYDEYMDKNPDGTPTEGHIMEP